MIDSPAFSFFRPFVRPTILRTFDHEYIYAASALSTVTCFIRRSLFRGGECGVDTAELDNIHRQYWWLYFAKKSRREPGPDAVAKTVTVRDICLILGAAWRDDGGHEREFESLRLVPGLASCLFFSVLLDNPSYLDPPSSPYRSSWQGTSPFCSRYPRRGPCANLSSPVSPLCSAFRPPRSSRLLASEA